mgnify:FL=1
MSTDKVIFLHDNKRKVMGQSRAEYAKGRKEKAKRVIALAKSKGLVTETTWELVVGKSMAGNKQNRWRTCW